ncbi:MAG: hypothetical protein NC299_09285 [Lachnospiraceae bacterium]|nr:hypothetical protein [Ruminococcus sp.]MCM1275546.1 hypothetical protein [Lachnospiraceae bacterium]
MNLKKTIATAAAVAILAVAAPITNVITNPFNITASAEEYKAGDSFTVCVRHLIVNDFALNGDDCAYFYSCKVLDNGTLSIATICPAVGVSFGHITIPDEIMGHTVSQITGLQPTNTTVTIPNTVTSISDNALEYNGDRGPNYNDISEIIGEAVRLQKPLQMQKA